MEFRRMWGTPVWHWRSQCSTWPDVNSELQDGLPRGGRLCPECEALDLKSALRRLEEEEAAAQPAAAPMPEAQAQPRKAAKRKTA